MTKKEFTQITSNYDSHRPLLWEALEATSGLVVEMGIGYGSTPFLSKYCEKNIRNLISYENNKEWFDKFDGIYEHEIVFIQNWEQVNMDMLLKQGVSVLFIDHAPGERRKVDIAKYANHAKIIVAHDTEPAADHGYKMRAELKKFKYMIDYETDGAWATAVINFIDVTKWKDNFK
jgi:hypothetical protein